MVKALLEQGAEKDAKNKVMWCGRFVRAECTLCEEACAAACK